MSIALFPYQRDAADAIHAAHRTGILRPGISMSTGGGKTIVFSKVIEESNERALVIAHRKELIDQAAQKVGYVIDPTDVGVVMADRNQYDAPVVIASIQTITNPKRLARLGQFGLVVIDEAHHAASPSYVNVLNQLGVGRGMTTKALGVSATWDRTDGASLEHVFDEIVYTVGLEQLIASGHLSDVRAVAIETTLNTSGIPGRDGDFNVEALYREIVESNYADTLAHAVKEHGGERSGLVFAPNVRTAHVYADALNALGIASAVVHGGTPALEREAAIARLRDGAVQLLVNVGVFTEGTDFPWITLVVMGRPTKSRALYQQMAGRGLRRYPGKTECLILDLVGVASRLDLQTAASLIGREAKDGPKKIDSFKDWIDDPDLYADEFVGDGSGVDVKGPLGRDFVQSAKPIDLIDRTRLAWSQLDVGTFSLPAGQAGQVVIAQDKRGTFGVVQYDGRNGTRNELGTGLDIGYAQGVAEAFVSQAGADVLADPNASWRRRKAPATDKQKSALEKWKIAFAPDITKVEASELLDVAITKANLRRRNWGGSHAKAS